MRLFKRLGRPEEGSPVLDLACGAGRHLPHLRSAGHTAIGIDLSRTLLAEARLVTGGSAGLVRGDMRHLPFADAAFGAVTSFFTSFGYFETVEEDEGVAREIGRVLRPGGIFLLDYLNAPHVRAHLVPSEDREVGDTRIRQTRWIENAAVMKKIELFPADGGEPEVHYERVRLYDPAELQRLLERQGLVTAARFGDYEGGPHTRHAPRLILVGNAR